MFLVTQIAFPLFEIGGKRRFFWIFRKTEKTAIKNLNTLDGICAEEEIVDTEYKLKEAFEKLEEKKKKLKDQ